MPVMLGVLASFASATLWIDKLTAKIGSSTLFSFLPLFILFARSRNHHQPSLLSKVDIRKVGGMSLVKK